MPEAYTRRRFLKSAILGGSALFMGLSPVLLPLRAQASASLSRQTAIFMGTLVNISVWHKDMAQAEDAIARAFELGRRQERIFTRFDSSSPLGLLNAQGSLDDAPLALTELLGRARRLHILTEGAFDATILPLISHLEKASRAGKRPDRQEMRDALELVGFEQLETKGTNLRMGRQGMGLTLDGIAKGHVAQVMSRSLVESGCPNHLVDAGGDMVVRGDKGGDPWRVAVEDPQKKGCFPQILALPATGCAVATSGVYEMRYDVEGRHVHLLDPSTGQGSPLAGVTVCAPDGLMADALATALSVMPPREALILVDSLPGCSCCLLHKDGLLQASARWFGQSPTMAGA